VSIANGCRYGGKGGRPGVLPRRRQGHGGRTLSPSPNPQEVMTKRKMKTRKRGR
jgi:hypothetical protein